jgi:integrase
LTTEAPPIEDGEAADVRQGNREAETPPTSKGSVSKLVIADSISQETRKLVKHLGLKQGRSFYALRHTFETIGGEAKDQIAVDAIMGHVRDDMASLYRERISDDRLRAVVQHVRNWLFGETGNTCRSAQSQT